MAGFLLELQMIDDQSQPERELENEDGMSDEAAVQALLQQGADEADPEAADAPEGSEQEDPEAATEAEEAPKRRLKVGDDELDEEEVVAGYMKDKDYRQKTAEVAEARRKAEQLQSYVTQELASRVSRLDVVMAAMHKELIGDQQELESLVRTNPAEYLARKHQLDQKVNSFQQAMQERQAYERQQQQDADTRHAEYLTDQRQRLLERLPAWKDQAKAAGEQREIADLLVSSYGYAPEELSELADHRALLLARDAMLYRKSQSLAQKKVAAPVAAPIKAGTPNPGNERAEQDMFRRLKKTGRDEDAVAILLSRNKR